MFFKLHSEHKIGYKRLSPADLGKGTSHQTHIGLYGDVLNFLPSTDVVQTAMLICDDYCDIIDCYFDRIENPDGTFRSPKIRLGNTDSVVRHIRDFASKDANAEWYLVWFGLDSQELVFMLIKNASPDYEALSRYLSSARQVIDDTHPAFTAILRLIEQKIDMVSSDLQEELEIVAQVGEASRKYKPYDIERAKDIFRNIGRTGEELVNQYLEREKSLRHISYFQWMNASLESGLPFDFIIDAGLSTSLHIDVKSTNFRFEQPIVFSSGEIDFIHASEYVNYRVYRVFDMGKEQKSLKICSSLQPFADEIHAQQLSYLKTLEKLRTKVSAISYSVPPTLFKASGTIAL